MGSELLDAVRRAAADPTVRSVLITGAGKSFCAGADVKNAREITADNEPDLSSRLRGIYNPVITAMRSTPKPFVAGIHGACAGLGVSLALACDLVVAAEDAYLLLAFVRIGVMPDGGATAFLAECVGMARAAQLCMLGDALATRLAAAPTVAIGSMKQAFNAAAHNTLAEQLELEADLQQVHADTDDYAEGRAAFTEKRAARFTGR